MKDPQMPNNGDPNNQRYSDAYDAGVRNDPCPSVVGLDREARAAVELGYSRGRSNEEFISRVNANDPSADFLNRAYHKRHKWDFTKLDEAVASQWCLRRPFE